MKKEYADFEKNLKGANQFGWRPSYKATINPKISGELVSEAAQHVMEELGWEVVYQDAETTEAKRSRRHDDYTESVIVTLNKDGAVSVESKSVHDMFWDNGWNVKTVSLFLYAFQQYEESLTRSDIDDLSQEVDRKSNWTDYELPTSLPPPENRKEPKPAHVWFGMAIVGVLLGAVVAFLSTKGLYLIGAFELGMGMILGMAFKALISSTNYTHWNGLRACLAFSVVTIFVSNQYFQYAMLEFYTLNFSFIEFMKLRLEVGAVIKSSELGVVGLLITWGIQLGLTYLFGQFRLGVAVVQFQIEKVPEEVTDFAVYHFIKSKNIDTVRAQLAKMGWRSERQWQDVLESVSAQDEIRQYRRDD